MTKKQPEQTIDLSKLDSIKQHIAYKMWEDAGRPEGCADEHWLAACDTVDAMVANTAELPAWLNRMERPAEAIQEAAAEKEATIEPKAEGTTRLHEVARRFTRAT